jgi:hypothetical protein
MPNSVLPLKEVKSTPYKDPVTSFRNIYQDRSVQKSHSASQTIRSTNQKIVPSNNLRSTSAPPRSRPSKSEDSISSSLKKKPLKEIISTPKKLLIKTPSSVNHTPCHVRIKDDAVIPKFSLSTTLESNLVVVSADEYSEKSLNGYRSDRRYRYNETDDDIDFEKLGLFPNISNVVENQNKFGKENIQTSKNGVNDQYNNVNQYGFISSKQQSEYSIPFQFPSDIQEKRVPFASPVITSSFPVDTSMQEVLNLKSPISRFVGKF